ncbi:MAG TPA: ABC transporter permease subunit [Gemmata sp.]
MNALPAAIRTARWMVRDTFRQSLASKLFWVMLGLTAVCTLFCLSVSITGDEPGPRHPDQLPLYVNRLDLPQIGWDKIRQDTLAHTKAEDAARVGWEESKRLDLKGFTLADAERTGREELLRRRLATVTPEELARVGRETVEKEGLRIVDGEVSLGFGLHTYPLRKTRENAAREVQLWLAGIVADTAGVLLALLWTAGFLPTFLEPQAVTVLLAKPAPRWSLLAGKYAGVVLFVALHATLFVGGTWLGLGIATGLWDARYWLAVPLLVANFAVFYAFSAFLAVCTRSTVVSVFGTLLFWLLCWAMNFTYLRLTAFPLEGITPVTSFLVEAGYWVLPKPLDMSGIFFDALDAGTFSTPVPELDAVKQKGRFQPELSVLASLAFVVGALSVAAYEFRHMDY